MFNRKSLVVVATALSIGAGSFVMTAPVAAAPAPSLGALESVVETSVTEVGRKGRRHRRHGRKHGRRHFHKRHHRRHFGFKHGHFGGCHFKTVKKWDPFEGGWVFYKKRYCY